MAREWDERRETQIAVTIASLVGVERPMDSQMISQRLNGSRPGLGELSEEERDRMRTVQGLNETDVLVLHSVEALRRDGIVIARALESNEWPYVLRYEDIALTLNGRNWISTLRQLSALQEPEGQKR